MPPGPRQFAPHDVLEAPAIEQPGEAVRDGLLFQLVMGLGMMDRNSGEGRQDLKGLQVPSGVFPGRKIVHIKHADDLVSVHQRNTDQ